MSPVVRISNSTYEGLKSLAEPFTDTPDSIIVHLLSFYKQHKNAGKTLQSTPNEELLSDPVVTPPSISVPKSRGQKHASPVKFYEKCIARINQKLNKHLIKNGKVTYSSSDKTTNVVLLNSKTYSSPRGKSYWYGFRPNQNEFLSSQEASFVAFGCGSENKIILIPFDRFKVFIPKLKTTNDEDGKLVHSHVFIVESKEGFDMRVGDRYEDITDFVL